MHESLKHLKEIRVFYCLNNIKTTFICEYMKYTINISSFRKMPFILLV